MSNSDNEVSITSDRINQSQVNEQLRCSVCHEDFHLSEAVSRLVCDHVFHPTCISPWLERRDTCPVCRRVLRDTRPLDLDTDTDDDLFADDEDDDAVVDQELVVVDNQVGDGLVTVSVQYRSVLDQHPPVLHNITTSDGSITFSDSDSDSDVFPGFLDSNSPSISSGHSVDQFGTSLELSGDIEILSDCDDSHVCFLELDDSCCTDLSDGMDVDFVDTLESDELNSSNFFEANIEVDHD